MQAIALKMNIPASRKIRLSLPKSIPAGEAELIVVVPESGIGRTPRGTGKMIRASKLFGMWRSRKDIADSVLFARSLRKRVEARHD